MPTRRAKRSRPTRPRSKARKPPSKPITPRVANTQIQLGYTTIRSPIDGRTGNLMVKQGNVVNANDIDLVTINQV